jgi:hypothetical protein
MNTKQTAAKIFKMLKSIGAPIATSYLVREFGNVSAALDLLQAQRKIIRVRGQGARIELA